ncbi:MAG TPA: TVP38/TMEM64 family protein [Chthoniobacterales bacterium]
MLALLIAAREFPLVDWVKSFAQWAHHFGTPGALIYGIVFGLTSVLMVPCLPLTIVAGFTFGMWNGLLAVSFGIAIGAAIGFLFARYAARGAVAQRIARNPRFNAIDEAITRDGWKIIGLLRMCPVPFGLTNYLYGLTGVGFWRYMGASMIGMLPGSVAFVYVGAFGKQTLDGPRDPIQYALGALTLIAMVSVTIMLGRIARRAAGADFDGGEMAAG